MWGARGASYWGLKLPEQYPDFYLVMKIQRKDIVAIKTETTLQYLSKTLKKEGNNLIGLRSVQSKAR